MNTYDLKCPKCNSRDVELVGAIYGDTATQRAYICNDCVFEWEEIYPFEYVE